MRTESSIEEPAPQAAFAASADEGPPTAVSSRESGAQVNSLSESSHADAAYDNSQSAPARVPAAPSPRNVHVPAATTTPRVDSGASPSTEQSTAPRIIYTAELILLAERPAETIDRIIELATANGGFLQERSDSGLSVRVPVGQFRLAMTAIERLGDVSHRSVRAEDISEQYHDLEVQLASLHAVQRRLNEFLARTSNMTEALSIEHELERVGMQIDQIEGRMRFLSSRAAYSTITVNVTRQVTAVLQAIPRPTNTVEMPFPWLTEIGVGTLLQLR
jgi:hypothetical protein